MCFLCVFLLAINRVVWESGLLSSQVKTIVVLSNTFADLDFECQAASSETVWKPHRHAHICRIVHEGDTAKASKGLLHLFIFILWFLIFFCLIKLLNQPRTDCILTGHCSALGDVCWTIYFRMQLMMKRRRRLDCDPMSGNLLSAEQILDVRYIQASIFSKFMSF